MRELVMNKILERFSVGYDDIKCPFSVFYKPEDEKFKEIEEFVEMYKTDLKRTKESGYTIELCATFYAKKLSKILEKENNEVLLEVLISQRVMEFY